ncbi:PAS domain S-box protein [Caenispirillum bisanense]|uniref:histidine kinase n=1 Tax=Caenispirillum bisanense TaxID=414052 RepID=A0A286GI25_9PROT|nr:PAS domain S-box protein [Caenispirillum bisanense]SOD95160.1 PAS domain S-box-containing protein [Caenispirillum bisanense]
MTRRSDAILLAAAATAVGGILAAASAPLTGAAAGPAGGAVALAAAGWLAVEAVRCKRRMRVQTRLLDGTADAVVAVTPARVVVAANRAARDLFGEEPPLTGRLLEDIVPGAGEAATLATLGTERNGVRECTGRALDGSDVPLEVTARTLHDGITILAFRDASQRHLADAALRRKLRELENNTRLLREIETLARIGCYDFYPGADEALWSRELERIFGLEGDPANPIRSFDAFLARVHPDDLPLILADAEDQTWREKERMFRIVRLDGEVRHIFSKGYREFGPDGRVVRLFGIDQDVTDRVAAEAALRDSEETLRRVFDSAPVPLVLVDQASGRPLAANRGARQLFEVGEEELGGLRSTDFYDDPADRDRLMATIAREGGVAGWELRLRTRKGRTLWLETSGTLISYQGRPAFLGGFVDIDARKQAAAALRDSEDRLRSLLARLPLPLSVVRLSDGRILFCNDLAAVYLGVSPADAVGLGAVGFFVDRQEFDRVMGALRRDRCLRDMEFRLPDGPDGARWGVASAVALEYEGEDAAVSVGIEITDRRRAEEILARAKVDAETLARAKSEFMAVMSHEIRTPMSGILGMVQLLAGTRLTKTQASYVDTIQRAGDTLLRLMGDILDVGRIEAGTLALAEADFAPRDLLDRIATLMRPWALSKRLELSVEVADGIPPLLRGDEGRINQLLFHLVSNALKVTERGGVRLRMRPLGAAPAGGLRVQIAVDDSGPGIPEDQRDRLFERFAVADASAARQHGGAGLGLALCKGLVTAMGGRIGFDTMPGRGSTFWVTLDLGEGEAPADANGGVAAEAPPGGLRVLLVEDDKVNRMLAVELLRRAGHRVKAAADGLDGVAAAAEGVFDLVLMDLHMPGIDGAEAIRRIRALPDTARATVPIVVLTADITEEGRTAAREAGADTVIAKPFRIDVVNRVVADLLGRPLPLVPPRATADAVAGPSLPREPAPPPRAAPPRAPAPPVPAPAPAADRPALPPLDPRLVPSDSLIVRQWDDLGPEAVRGLVELFRTTTPPRMETLDAAITGGDAATVVDEAHALKGAAGVLGLTPLHRLYQEVEGDALAGDLDAVAQTMPALRRTYDETLRALAAFDAAPAADGVS